MDPEPPVVIPEPPVDTPPEPSPTICGAPDYFTFEVSATEQSTIDALASCEEIYSLSILAPLDLRPLASLRHVGNLYLSDVASLEGLENVEDATSVVLTGAATRSAKPLSGLSYADYLRVDGTRLVDLSGLENVRGVTNLVIQNNIELDNLSGLFLEDLINYVTILDNPTLRDATSLDSLRQAWVIEIARNPQLTGLPVFSQLTFLDTFILTDNAALVATPEFPSIANLVTLTIWTNAALERITFSALEYATAISIFGNPSLVEINLPLLSQAGYANVYYNQQLDGVALGQSLAGVITSTLRVAPDQTQLMLDPCPWTTDTQCDESVLCAIGTDPVCSRYE
jgi:hypothetical protein